MVREGLLQTSEGALPLYEWNADVAAIRAGEQLFERLSVVGW